MHNPFKKLERKIRHALNPKVPEPKVIQPEIVDESKKADIEEDRRAKRRGRASTFLTDDYRTVSKTLLGE